MNFGDVKQRLTDVYGGKDLSNDDDFYGRCVNDAYGKICAYKQWWWLETYTALTFSAPVVINVPYTCIKGLTTIQPAVAGGALPAPYTHGWISTDENTYRVLAINASAPYEVTLDTPFLETSGSHNINAWNDTLPLPDTFDRVVGMAPRLDQNVQPLANVPFSEIESRGPDMSEHYVDVAQLFSIYRETEISDGFRVRIWPPPDTPIDYIFRFRQTPVDLSSDSDIPLIPTKHHTVLADAARMELLVVTGGEQQEVTYWTQQMLAGLDRMIRDANRRGKAKYRFKGHVSVTEQALDWRMVNYTQGVDTD